MIENYVTHEIILGRYIKLEMRKNRLVFVALVSAFLVSLPLAFMYSALWRAELADAFNALFMFWALAGLALSGLILGGNAGAGLRAELAENAENLLPISHGGRIFASYCAVAAHMALLACVMSAAALVTGAKEYWFLGIWVLYVPVLYAAAVAFIFAYISRNGFFGGLMGLVFAGLFVVGAFYPYIYLVHDTAIIYGLTVLCAVLGTVASFIVFVKKAGRARHMGVISLALLTLCLLAGQIMGGGYAYARLKTAYHRLFVFCDSKDYLRKTDGVFLMSRGGDLLWVNGVKAKALRAATGELSDIVLRPSEKSILDLHWDTDGSIWLLVQEKFDCKVLHGGLDGKFETIMSVPYGYTLFFSLVDGKIGLRKWENGVYVAARIIPGEPLLWKVMGENLAPQNEIERADSETARDADFAGFVRKPAGGKTVHWKLPGKDVHHSAINYISAGNQTTLLACVVETGPKRASLVIGYPDGKIREVWAGEEQLSRPYPVASRVLFDSQGRPLPDAKGDVSVKYAVYGADSAMYFITADGRFLPPINIRALFKDTKIKTRNNFAPIVLHSENYMVWVEYDGIFLKYDLAAGKTVQFWDLTAYYGKNTFTVPTDNGVYLFDDVSGSMRFVDWNGAVKNVDLKR